MASCFDLSLLRFHPQPMDTTAQLQDHIYISICIYYHPRFSVHLSNNWLVLDLPLDIISMEMSFYHCLQRDGMVYPNRTTLAACGVPRQF